jgi:transcriptional regulator with XRE-family HTH domain
VNPFGQFVRQQRDRLGLTQVELAAKTGGALSPADIAKMETASKLPRADRRRILAEALEVPHLRLLMAAGEINDQDLLEALAYPPADWRALDPITQAYQRLPAEVQAHVLALVELWPDEPGVHRWGRNRGRPPIGGNRPLTIGQPEEAS